MRGNKRTFPNFHICFLISMNSNSFQHKTLERRWHDFFHLKWKGCLKNIWISFGKYSNSKTLCDSMIFTREDKMTSSNYMKYELGVSKKLNSKPPLNLFSIWNRSSCIFYFLAFWSILEISRNSRTLGESWRFCYFHIWVFSNFEKRIIWFIYFIFNYFSGVKIYERGNNINFPNLGKMKI